jgi:hypothetical protein
MASKRRASRSARREAVSDSWICLKASNASCAVCRRASRASFERRSRASSEASSRRVIAEISCRSLWTRLDIETFPRLSLDAGCGSSSQKAEEEHDGAYTTPVQCPYTPASQRVTKADRRGSKGVAMEPFDNVMLPLLPFCSSNPAPRPAAPPTSSVALPYLPVGCSHPPSSAHTTAARAASAPAAAVCRWS